MNETINIVKEIGFPLFAAVYLLLRIDPTLRKIEITCARLLQYLQNHHS